MRLSKKALDGNVETIILAELSKGANYGYALVREINRAHEGLLRLGEGTIYPVLYRMEERGLVSAEILQAEGARPRKYYRLTERGTAALAEDLRQWGALSKVMERVRQETSNEIGGLASEPA